MKVFLNNSSDFNSVQNEIKSMIRGGSGYLDLSGICYFLGAALINGESDTKSPGRNLIVYGHRKFDLDIESGKYYISSPDLQTTTSGTFTCPVIISEDSVFVSINDLSHIFGFKYKLNNEMVLGISVLQNYRTCYLENIKGDGITDDGPYITGKIQEISSNGGNAALIFPKNKKIFIGEKANRFPYFLIKNLKNISIEGNGCEIILNRKNSAFRIENCENISIRNLNFDYKTCTYIQGVVESKDCENSSINIITDMESALPPDAEFVSSQSWPWAGGAGLHGLVFEKDKTGRDAVRKFSSNLPYHFMCKKIEKVENNFSKKYKMTLTSSEIIKRINEGDKITYGLSHIYMKRGEFENKLNLGYTELLDIYRCSNVLLEDVNIYASLSMGARISDNYGKVTLRRTNIIIKPGTNRLLATPSDGIHTKNNRVGITMDDCIIESTGDDNLNISTMFDYVYEVVSEKVIKVKTVDVPIFFYHIKKGDKYTFFDLSRRIILGQAHVVEDPVYDIEEKVTTIEFDSEIHGIYAAQNDTSNPLRLLNHNMMAHDTEIKNCIFRPVFRNSMFGNFDSGKIINNKFIGSRGGIIGLNFCGDADVFTGSAHVLAYSKDIEISGNEFCDYQWNAILQRATEIKYTDNLFLTRNIKVENNIFTTQHCNIAVFENIHKLHLNNNTIKSENIAKNQIEVISCTD